MKRTDKIAHWFFMTFNPYRFANCLVWTLGLSAIFGWRGFFAGLVLSIRITEPKRPNPWFTR